MENNLSLAHKRNEKIGDTPSQRIILIFSLDGHFMYDNRIVIIEFSQNVQCNNARTINNNGVVSVVHLHPIELNLCHSI